MNVGVAVIWYCCATAKARWVSIWINVTFVWVFEREWKCGSIVLHGPHVSEVKKAIASAEEVRREVNSDVVVG
jgi:hypothetical protein